jgi:hypothetical protein
MRSKPKPIHEINMLSYTKDRLQTPIKAKKAEEICPAFY